MFHLCGKNKKTRLFLKYLTFKKFHLFKTGFDITHHVEHLLIFFHFNYSICFFGTLQCEYK